MSQVISTTFSFTVAALPRNTFQVVHFVGEEWISRCFQFELTLAATDPSLDLAELVGEAASLTIDKDGVSRPTHGIVTQFEQLEETTPGTYLYRAVLEPRFARLKLSKQNQIFGTISPVDVTAILSTHLGTATRQAGPARHGTLNLAQTDFEIRATKTYPTRDYVVQYDETDHDFVCRLGEHWGLFFYFDHSTGVDRVVFGDSNVNFSAIAGTTAIRYAGASVKTSAGTNSVSSFGLRSRQIAAQVVLRDYNYRAPTVNLLSQQAVDTLGFGWVNEYDDHFRTPAEGTILAQVRAEEKLCRKLVYHGKSDCTRFVAGHCFHLTQHYRPSFNGEYLLISVRHEGSQPVYGVATLGGRMASGAPGYENSFTAIPAGTPFRPERTTRRPKICGLMTGRVDGAGDGSRAELDELGRYKVLLQFDLGGYPAMQASQYIRKAEPYAGLNTGMHFPLLKGTEVLLAHIDGDPDRPIIIGAVPDAASLIVANNQASTGNRIVTSSGAYLEIQDGPGTGQTASASGSGRSSTPATPSSGAGNQPAAPAANTQTAAVPAGQSGGSAVAAPSQAALNADFDQRIDRGLALDAVGAAAGLVSGGIKTWMAPSGGVYVKPGALKVGEGMNMGSAIRLSEPSTNGYFRIGSYSETAEKYLPPRIASVAKNFAVKKAVPIAAKTAVDKPLTSAAGAATPTPSAASADAAAAPPPIAASGDTVPTVAVPTAAPSVSTSQIPPIDTDGQGALQYVIGDRMETTNGDSVTEVTGSRATQIDANQWTQINGNAWNLVGGTSENQYVGDYKTTYYDCYTSYTLGTKTQIVVGSSFDIALGSKYGLVMAGEDKLNVQSLSGYRLEGASTTTLLYNSSFTIGAKTDTIWGFAKKKVCGVSQTKYEGDVQVTTVGDTAVSQTGLVSRVVIGDQTNTYTGDVTTTMLGDIDSMLLGAKEDVRIGDVSTTTLGVKRDQQLIKWDITELAKVEQNGTRTEVTEADVKVYSDTVTAAGIAAFLNGETSFF